MQAAHGDLNLLGEDVKQAAEAWTAAPQIARDWFWADARRGCRVSFFVRSSRDGSRCAWSEDWCRARRNHWVCRPGVLDKRMLRLRLLQRSFTMARIDRTLRTSRAALYRAASTKTFNFRTLIKCESLSWGYDLSNYDCAMSLLSGANAFSCDDRQHHPRRTAEESAPSHSTSL